MDVARALQAYAMASLFATYLTGVLLDRVPARWGLLVSMILLVMTLLVPMGVRSTPVGSDAL